MATRASPELVWGSFRAALRAERGGNPSHDDSVEEKLSRPRMATPLVVRLACLNSATRGLRDDLKTGPRSSRGLHSAP
eukprot:8104706-Alexandrium_andersonii.AAC.1